MVIVTNNDDWFIKYKLTAPNNGGSVLVDQRDGVGRWSISTSAIDTLDVRNLVNDTTGALTVDGDVTPPYDPSYSRAQQIVKLQAILGFEASREGVQWWFQGLNTYSSGDWFPDLWALMLAEADSTNLIVMFQYIANEVTEGHAVAPSWCEDGLQYLWDMTNDNMLIIGSTDTVGWSNIVGTNIVTQADVKAFFESIYNDGIWDYAWDTGNGNICVRYRGTGSPDDGTFTFSVTLSEEINASDEVSAFIIRKENYNREWSRPR